MASTMTASQEFAHRKAEALALLDKVRERIEEMAAEQANAPGNWGYVGSMGRVMTLLDEAAQ